MSEDINVRFIIPQNISDENDCSEEMQLAFINCEQHSSGGLKAEWVHETQYKNFEGLTKKDVFVLNEFDGEFYHKLRATKCLLVGPRCLSCCITEGTPIPSGPEPVFTIAMKGLVVTASGLSKQQKDNIKKKVFWMGGIYNTVLTDDTTHLVSDTVLSDKYIKSVEKGIPIMCESWIEAVWDISLRLNVNGSSADFDVHRLPPFANLQVTTSGITKRDKQMITKLVNEHGGTFSGAFQSETTDIVVVTKDGVGSEKYKAALEYGKACVLPAWIKDSASRGVALPLAQYKVVGASTSSPLAEHRLPDMSLNFSRITNLRPPSNFVDESRAPDMSTLSGKMKLSQDSKKADTSMDRDVQMAIENLDMSCIKKAGPIFDGFCIWLCGVAGVCRERLSACISRGGGVRYDAAHARVTHAVAGSARHAARAAAALPHVPVLSALWLVRSVEAGLPLDETAFLIDTKPCTPAKSRLPRTEVASPMSKRNLMLLRPPAPAAAPPAAPDAPPDSHHRDQLLEHYLSQPMPEPEKTKTPEPVPSEPAPASTVCDDVTDVPDITEEVEQIFRGIKLEVYGLEEDAICEVSAEVGAAGGVVAARGAGGSHVLVPLDFDPQELGDTTAEPVTVFWVKDCLSQQELVPIQYYHRPVKMGSFEGPLRGVVASLSTYSGVERAFLDELAKLLGATTQLRFCRRNTSNALASTHLICPTASGDKYVGAVKWGLPAVTARWLTDCAAQARRLPEGPYLVGDTKEPPQPEADKPVSPKMESEPDQTSKPGDPKDVVDKENAMLPPAFTNVLRRGSHSNADTPKQKTNAEDNNEMSPASRYIAMARQGLLGCSQDTPTTTPKRVMDLKGEARQEGDNLRTPPLDDALSTPNLQCLSPTTRRRIQAVRRGEMPSDPIRTPTDPFVKQVSTPDSAFGAALRPDTGRMSPEARKRLWEVVDQLPSHQPQPEKSNTPLSEIRNRFLAQFNSGASATPPTEHNVAPRKLHLQDEADTPPAKMPKVSADQSAGGMSTESHDSAKSTPSASKLSPAVDAQLQRLSEALNGLTSQRQRRATRDSLSRPIVSEAEAGPESQPNTVGWDDSTPAPAQDPPRKLRIFMLSSNVDNREEIIEMITHLGGEVCEGTEPGVEPTHLLCAAPGRSEKMLGSIAAGRWVLHPAYVARSRAAGHFLPEEEFEWGNPLATCLPPVSGSERTLGRASHRWRAARATGAAGPFAGVRALLHVPPARHQLLARLVRAGGGHAHDMQPPYTDANITVCFADVKRYPLSPRDTQFLISNRIPVCAPVLLSSYLTDETTPNPVDHCMPEFRLT